MSVCQINGGKNYNVICDEVQLVGTARCFTAEGRDTIIRRMEELCAGIGAAHGAAVTLKYTKGYPPTVNAYPDKTAQLRAAAEKIVGGGCHDPYLTMAAEDFSYFLQERPCVFAFGRQCLAVSLTRLLLLLLLLLSLPQGLLVFRGVCATRSPAPAPQIQLHCGRIQLADRHQRVCAAD